MVAILHVVAMLKCYEKRFIQVLTCAFTGWNIEFVIIPDFVLNKRLWVIVTAPRCFVAPHHDG